MKKKKMGVKLNQVPNRKHVTGRCGPRTVSTAGNGTERRREEKKEKARGKKVGNHLKTPNTEPKKPK